MAAIPWVSISAKPIVGKPILMRGDSGHRAPHDTFVISGYYDPGYRPLSPWLDCCGDQLSDHGWKPTHWTYLNDLVV